jgi:hypothetical protein
MSLGTIFRKGPGGAVICEIVEDGGTDDGAPADLSKTSLVRLGPIRSRGILKLAEMGTEAARVLASADPGDEAKVLRREAKR